MDRLSSLQVCYKHTKILLENFDAEKKYLAYLEAFKLSHLCTYPIVFESVYVVNSTPL